MPKCKTCSNYWTKDWSINYECRLGHSTPDFGDTDACGDYEEQFTIGIESGWSYEKEKNRNFSNSTTSKTKNKVHKSHDHIQSTEESTYYSGSSGSGGESYSSGVFSHLWPPSNIVQLSKDNFVAVVLLLICTYLWIGGPLIHEKHAFNIIEAMVKACWSPTSDSVLNFVINCMLLIAAVVLGICSFIVGIALALILAPIALLVWIAGLSPFGAVISLGVVLLLVYNFIVKK